MTTTEQMTVTEQTMTLYHSIVMPAYNEEDVLAQTIEALCTYLEPTGYRYEIIIIDDNSSDRTAEISSELASRYSAVHAVNNAGPNGYGYAIRKGLEVYQGDSVVVVTSDGADAPKDIIAYWSKIEQGYDCAFGSRFINGAVVERYPLFKRLINRSANYMLSCLLRTPYRDITNGFKCYRREVIDDMAPIISGQFNITIELALKALLGEYSYAVVPTDWKEREGGQSSFGIAKLIKPYTATMLYCLTRHYILLVKR